MEMVSTIYEAAQQVGKIIAAALSVSDRQRVNFESTSVLFHGPLTSTEWTLLYEASTNIRTEIKEYIISNNEENKNNVSFCIVPKGLTPGDDHLVLPLIEIEGKEYKIIHTKSSLLGGWNLYARAGAVNRVVLHISGTELIN